MNAAPVSRLMASQLLRDRQLCSIDASRTPLDEAHFASFAPAVSRPSALRVQDIALSVAPTAALHS